MFSGRDFWLRSSRTKARFRAGAPALEFAAVLDFIANDEDDDKAAVETYKTFARAVLDRHAEFYDFLGI